ncbi:MAG: hypothetical protein IJ309_05525 [Clostridia bacterium]|nr:hypothetical protein [Clostridia bacterium]
MKKVILALVMVLAMLFVLVSCGGGDTPPDTTDTGGGTQDSGSGSGTTCVQHDLGEWEEVLSATCTRTGTFIQRCKNCSYSRRRPEPKTGHTEVIDEAIEATCKTTGKTEGSHCSVCNAVIKAQNIIPVSNVHQNDTLVKVVKTPSIGSSGSAVFRCTLCGLENTENLPALTTSVLTRKDTYEVTTDEYNPAEGNRYKVLDGNKNTAGIYNAGDDWFGYVGDKLVITLSQEMILKDFYIYTAGNYTFATVRVKNAAGSTKVTKTINANGSAYGGEGQKHTVFEGQAVQAYTIEIEITNNKDNYQYFKVSELEIHAAKPDVRLPHSGHDYREIAEIMKPSTCQTRGEANYACFCGATKGYYMPKVDHDYSVEKDYVAATCETDGKAEYYCSYECGYYTRKTIEHKGHIYARFKTYVKAPTLSDGGEAVYQCIGCKQTEYIELSPLTLEDVKYLRVDSITSDTVTIKFNVYNDPVSYEIRYSTSEITNDNFQSATTLEASVTGSAQLSATLNLSVGLDNCYYVAVRPYYGNNYGNVSTIRVGGDKIVPIDYHSAKVYHGEVLNSFANMFDEQGDEYLNGTSVPETMLAKIFTDSSDTVLYGSNLSPIVDLEYKHYISKAYFYYAEAGKSVKVRWSTAPVDFMAADSEWDGTATFVSAAGWNEVAIGETTRYVQVVFKDGEAPYEMMVKGYQNGDGDKISTEKRKYPTIGEMMGMCGFVAVGAGNTPVDSVICSTVLREYHNVGWTYSFNKYPGEASAFQTQMGNFDEAYKSYFEAGINVIPCFQWDMTGTSLSNKVDSSGMLIKDGNSFVRADFWEKFDANTYFQYADAMFGFAARYGNSASTTLLNIAREHTTGEAKVGLGYIEWMELGNEPEGVWNGIHNYYSAYQLAALTSAGYDGHCRTLTSDTSDYGYHLGVKNADPLMKVAMAGISGTSNEYVTAMLYWMKANREDGKTALDAFNVHQYMSKQVTLPTGNVGYQGISPEEADIVGTLSQLVEIRDKYYTDKEVWITEFGWETNQSYGSTNAAHAYGDYTGKQVQAMWLTRTYILLSAAGIDKATMYMCENTYNAVDEEAVGKFATSGVIGFKYDENGNIVEYKKDSYFYLYTLKNTLGSYTFNQKIEAYDENVWIYEYKTEDGKTAYALWCPTSDGTHHDGYKLRIDGESATLVEAVNNDVDGVKTELEPDGLGYVTVNVSENPIYVVVD